MTSKLAFPITLQAEPVYERVGKKSLYFMTKANKVQSEAGHVHLEIVLSCNGHCGQNPIQLRHGRRGHGATQGSRKMVWFNMHIVRKAMNF